MKLYLDVREAALAALLPGAELKPLVLGDITIEDDDGKELVIIERKTVADLAASIKDGRYKEQSARLTAYSLDNHNVVYLIEGTLRTAKLPLPCETLMASMVSLWYGKGFSVMRTESLEQTAQFVQVMLKKLEKEKGYQFEAKENTSDVKRTKMDKITPDNIQALMLAQIPYVNTVTAEAMLQDHHTVAGLTTALRADPACLDKVKFLGEKGRKISSKSVESLKTFLKI
jgi:ERCC4-type nuclease